MEVLELAVSQFADLRPPSLFVRHFEDVDYLAVAFGLVVDDLGLEVHHVYLL